MQNLKIENFSGKNVWVIGASSGIGRELCLLLASQNCQVYASARKEQALNQLQSEFPNQIKALPLDVLDRQKVLSAFSQIKKLDMVIYLAADYRPLSLDDLSIENAQSIIDINFSGLIQIIELTTPFFKQQGHGHFSAFASIAGYIGLPSSSIYGATKAAVINLFESLHPEGKKYGIDFSIVNPGFVDTPLTQKNDFPMPFIMTPNKAAEETIKGYSRGEFCIVYPKGFSYFFRFLRILPYSLHLFLAKKLIKT